MCATCDQGRCPRHTHGARYELDFDPYYQDPGELAQERRDRIISAPDFEQPVGAA